MKPFDKETYEEATARLAAAVKAALPKLEALLAEAKDHWGLEDHVYRFYHTSFKTYRAQDLTLKLWAAFVEIGTAAGGLELDSRFARIVADGTGHTFDLSHNRNWDFRTRPIIEAAFHATFFLEQMCKYGREEINGPLPNGWAAVHTLYNLR